MGAINEMLRLAVFSATLHYAVNQGVYIDTQTSFGATNTPMSTMSTSSDLNITLSAEVRLVNDLLQRRAQVGNWSRPTLNSTQSILVGLSLALFQLLALDAKAQTLSTKIWKGYFWTDEYLVWNPAEYDGITQIQIPIDQIWVPDIVLLNNAGDEPTVPARAVMPVTFKGEANWASPVIYKSTCEINMNLFPYDSQTCNFTFGSWSYSLAKLNLVLHADLLNFDMSSYVTSSEWKIEKSTASRQVQFFQNGTVPWPLLIYTLTLRRQVGFYTYVLIVPSLVLSLLTPGLFWIPPSRPDRTTLGMSLFSSFFVLLLILVQSSPSSASVSKLGIYFTFNMTLIAMSTILSTIVIYMSSKFETQPVPQLIRTVFVRVLAPALLCHVDNSDLKLDSSAESSRKTCENNKNNSTSSQKTIGTSSINTSCSSSSNETSASTSAAAAAATSVGIQIEPSIAQSSDVTEEYILMLKNRALWKTIIAVLDRIFFITSFITNCFSIGLLFPHPE